MADHLQKFQFQPGQAKTPGSGRKTGTRNKLSERFLKDLHDEWERSGVATLKILAVENPAMLAALVAKVLPTAFDDEHPATLHIVTGVVRAHEVGPPQIPGPVPAIAPPDDQED